MRSKEDDRWLGQLTPGYTCALRLDDHRAELSSFKK